jgi:ADP-ribose pyrophosphatase YjhB (NUDIX family)
MDCSVHKLVADVAVTAGGRVLLARYRDTTRYDNQRGWFLPDDYLAHGEHPAAAAKRILAEQAGVELPTLRLFDVESFGGEKVAWHLVFHYVGELDAPVEIRPGKNVAAAEWFPVDALPPARQVAHGGWALDVLQQMGIIVAEI